MRIRILLTLVSVLSSFACAATPASDWHFEQVSRVVAVADIHGAHAPLLRTLRSAGVIDDTDKWAGGDAHLVIVGDLLDRGPDSRQVMDLLMRLEAEALAAGGRVHVLIGNHEAMNLIGDLRYVAAEEYAAFAGDETAEQRERGFAAWRRRQSGAADEAQLRTTFERAHPPGFFAHRAAFSAEGKYGAWLLKKPVIVVVNGTAFVHGGLSPAIAELGLSGVNGRLMQELAGYVRAFGRLERLGILLAGDNFYEHAEIVGRYMPPLDTPKETLQAIEAIRVLGESALHASDGPLWYRGNVYCSALIETDRLAATLAAIGARRVVIGHTPTQGRQVLERLDGRVIEIDTGMLSGYYNGRGHALIIEGDRVYAVAEGSSEALQPLPHPRRVGDRPGRSLSAEELEALLASGDIGEIRTDAAGRTIVSVSRGDDSVNALFAERAGRGFYPDVAAYRLDRLLDLQLVPVAVVREVGGDDGSLQFLPHRWVDEQQRAALGAGAGASCPLDLQWGAMYVFDTLIYNEGRTLARMLYSPDVWQLVLSGHSNAFASKRGRPRHLQPVPLAIGAAWRAALAALSDESLDEALADVLDRRRRRALLERRDQLLEER